MNQENVEAKKREGREKVEVKVEVEGTKNKPAVIERQILEATDVLLNPAAKLGGRIFEETLRNHYSFQSSASLSFISVPSRGKLEEVSFSVFFSSRASFEL